MTRLRISSIYLFTMILMFSFVLTVNAQEKREKDVSQQIDENYQQFAKKHSLDLMKKLDLTLDQTTEVRDILVEYQKDIADELRDVNDNDADLTGGVSDRDDRDADDVEGPEGDFRNIDKSANENIEEIVGEEKVAQYVNAKKDWWNKIKSHVFSLPVNIEEEAEVVEDENAEIAENENRNRDDEANLIGENDENRTRYDAFAKEMATELMNKLNLSLQQAADVKEALVNYQKDVTEKRRDLADDYTDDNLAMNDDEDRNVIDDNRSEKRAEAENERNEMVGSAKREFVDIDNAVNDDIRNVLTDSQKPKYEQIKDSWFNDLKTQAHSNVSKAIKMEKQEEIRE